MFFNVFSCFLKKCDPPRKFFLRNFLQPNEFALVRIDSDERRKWACAVWRLPITVADMTTINAVPELIDLRRIMSLTGMGRTAAYELTKNVDFPKPYRFGRKVIRWDLQEVSEWLTSCKGKQIPKSPRSNRSASKKPPKKILISGVGFQRTSVGGDE